MLTACLNRRRCTIQDETCPKQQHSISPPSAETILANAHFLGHLPLKEGVTVTESEYLSQLKWNPALPVLFQHVEPVMFAVQPEQQLEHGHVFFRHRNVQARQAARRLVREHERVLGLQQMQHTLCMHARRPLQHVSGQHNNKTWTCTHVNSCLAGKILHVQRGGVAGREQQTHHVLVTLSMTSADTLFDACMHAP